jgi:hypothetical protein
MSRHQKPGQNRNTKIVNGNVAEFKYLGTTVTNLNSIHKEIQGRLNSDNACYYSVQNFLFSCPSKNVKTRIYKTITFPVVSCGCEVWFLTLREEHRIRGFENRVLRRLFGMKGVEIIG